MQLQIERIDNHGCGVASVDGMSIICDGALPEEVVEVRHYTQRRHRTVAEDYSLLQSTAARVTPVCHHFGECGGCQLQHASYDSQLIYKQDLLRQALLRHGDVCPQQWLPPLSSPPFKYRRRVRLGVRCLNNDEVIIGFRRKAHSYLLDIDSCPIMEPRLQALLQPLHTLVRQLSIRQRLPQIEMNAGDQAIAVVFRHLLPFSEQDYALLRTFAAQHEVLVFTQSGGPETIRVLLSPQATILHYDISDYQIRLAFAATDFIQANATINRLMVDAVVKQLAVGAQDDILDLFCGIGNFSLPLARHTRTVTGIDGNPALVARAQGNAVDNGQHNVQFRQTDLAHWSPGPGFNKLLIDPPREGAIAVFKRLPADLPETIVYVSCMPKTLARDARYLVHRLGYTLTHARLVDMFPQTKHIEAIATFKCQ